MTYLRDAKKIKNFVELKICIYYSTYVGICTHLVYLLLPKKIVTYIHISYFENQIPQLDYEPLIFISGLKNHMIRYTFYGYPI